MRQLVTVITLCFSLGLSISTNAQDGNVVPQNLIPENAIDQICEIVRKDADPTPTVTDVANIAGKVTGKIVRFDDKAIVLVDATQKVRIQRGVPILSAIPYINRMFKNTAIADKKLPGELTINLSEIRSIKLVR